MTIFLNAKEVDDKEVMAYFYVPDIDSLLEGFGEGEIIFSYEQTLAFIRATDYLSRTLLNGDDQFNDLFFIFVHKITNRFANLKKFESYYLHYSTKVIELVREEFEKEPELRGMLEKILLR
ncbi:hypothetical protein [Pedobacter roseus]|uniref:Uncharacterized protein n=1 Tax=Pedobacter roseus TaxID=336820 RepID=A0A7G9QHZ0_9SPHI|nr:hypothetical protein [Pedobacter roseus]QNN42965.1 hypothetical protein H9L23_02330 [Pedobacter roseus]